MIITKTLLWAFIYKPLMNYILTETAVCVCSWFWYFFFSPIKYEKKTQEKFTGLSQNVKSRGVLYRQLKFSQCTVIIFFHSYL